LKYSVPIGRKRGRDVAEERTSRLSPAGRLRCAEAGRTNVQRAIEARRAAGPALKQAVAKFEEQLRLQVGQEPTVAQSALVLSATASFTALYLVLEKLRAARRFKRIEALVAELTPLQGGLLRSLRALGLAAGSGAPDDLPNDGGETLAEWVARHSATTGSNGDLLELTDSI
jgi:hypothetical protein